MLGAGKVAPTEFYRENQTIEWKYFSGFCCLVFFCFLAHCWSRGLYMMKLLTIVTGPSGLFRFNIECSTDFSWKSYWPDSFSVIEVALWKQELKTSCLSALVMQQELENSENQFSFHLSLKADPASFLFFFFSPFLAPSFRVFRDFCVCLGFFFVFSSKGQ